MLSNLEATFSNKLFSPTLENVRKEKSIYSINYIFFFCYIYFPTDCIDPWCYLLCDWLVFTLLVLRCVRTVEIFSDLSHDAILSKRVIVLF